MSLGIPLSLKGAEFRYPNSDINIFHNLDLEIRAGEWIALLGPNGSGKSTLLKLFNALLIPTQGFCFVGEKCTSDTDKVDDIRASAAMVFQNPDDQIVAAVVEEDTAFGPENIGLPSEVTRERVDAALSAVGLSGCRRSQVSSLSGGQKQRLAFAGALALAPGALLLDEALSMLDPNARRNFTQLVRKEHEAGMTIVQVTHRLDEIIYSDRVVVLDAGHVAMDMKTADFLLKTEEELAKLDIQKPPVSILRDMLCGAGLIPDSVAADIDAIRESLCR
ncbi:MAG: ATP-binding cassette domain-containing protein [Synergistaceae bacterium]|nr:ATP-binding cassette domain-containing protein [Synergistaceae bacterium]